MDDEMKNYQTPTVVTVRYSVCDADLFTLSVMDSNLSDNVLDWVDDEI